MKLQDVGEAEDKILFFGGPYGNHEALQALKNIALREGMAPEQIICTGDTVAYYAQPEQTVRLLREWGVRSILGNVEESIRENKEDCGCGFEKGSACDLDSAKWYAYCRKELSPSSVRWMGPLPDGLSLSISGIKVFVVHGAFSHISKNIDESTPWQEKEREFELAGGDIIVAGHSGSPFSQEKNGKLWVNAGVIGMPVDNTPRVWYAIFTALGKGALRIEHKSFDYDVQSALAGMRKAGDRLAQSYAGRLLGNAQAKEKFLELQPMEYCATAMGEQSC